MCNDNTGRVRDERYINVHHHFFDDQKWQHRLLIGQSLCVPLALAQIVVIRIAVRHVPWVKHEPIWMGQVVVSIA